MSLQHKQVIFFQEEHLIYFDIRAQTDAERMQETSPHPRSAFS